jgi:hypothetical protein
MSLRFLPETFHVMGSSAAATFPVVTATPQQRVAIYRMILTIAAPAVNVTIQDNSGAALSQTFQLAANGAIILDDPFNGEPWFTTAAGRGVQITQSGTSTIAYDFWYIQRLG